MQTIKLTEPVGNRPEGHIFQVDEESARILVEERKVAEVYDGEVLTAESAFGSTSTSRAGSVMQIAEADYPDQPPAAEVSRSSKHAELVVAAKAKRDAEGSEAFRGEDGEPLSDAAVEGQTKADLADGLGL